MNKIDLSCEMKNSPPKMQISFVTSVNVNGKDIILDLNLNDITYSGRYDYVGTETDEYFIPSSGVIQS